MLQLCLWAVKVRGISPASLPLCSVLPSLPPHPLFITSFVSLSTQFLAASSPSLITASACLSLSSSVYFCPNFLSVLLNLAAAG